MHARLHLHLRRRRLRLDAHPSHPTHLRPPQPSPTFHHPTYAQAERYEEMVEYMKKVATRDLQ